MELVTKCHGTFQYNEDEIMYFKKGLPGFVNLHKFILLNIEGNNFFKILHSIEDSNVGIVVVNPFEFVENYEFDIDDETLKDLKINSADEVLILNTVTLDSDVKKITTNLKAPIVININKNLGEQLILDNEKYAIKHPLIKE